LGPAILAVAGDEPTPVVHLTETTRPHGAGTVRPNLALMRLLAMMPLPPAGARPAKMQKCRAGPGITF
jgi:hypothetical protein